MFLVFFRGMSLKIGKNIEVVVGFDIVYEEIVRKMMFVGGGVFVEW